MCLFSACQKPINTPPAGPRYDTVTVTAIITYFNCENTCRLFVGTNKQKKLSNILGAGYGVSNLALSDTVTYKVVSTDTAHNQVKPLNLLKPGDSINVFTYIDLEKTQPKGKSGFSLQILIKSNNLYLINDSIFQPNPKPSTSYAYTYSYVMP